MLRKDYVYSLLKQRIAERFYQPGSKLPSEQQLAAELNVSRVTLRSALSLLQQEKLIEKNGRSGNYVSGFAASKRFIYLTFAPNLEELSLVTSYFVTELQNALKSPSPNALRHLRNFQLLNRGIFLLNCQ